MTTKKLTVPIARALAEQVKSKIQEKIDLEVKAAEALAVKSPEWKAYLKAKEVAEKAQKEVENASEKVQKLAFGKTKVRHINHWRGDISVDMMSTLPQIDVEDIKNKIIVDDYTSTGSETSEQLVNRLVTELTA